VGCSDAPQERPSPGREADDLAASSHVTRTPCATHGDHHASVDAQVPNAQQSRQCRSCRGRHDQVRSGRSAVLSRLQTWRPGTSTGDRHPRVLRTLLSSVARAPTAKPLSRSLHTTRPRRQLHPLPSSFRSLSTAIREKGRPAQTTAHRPRNPRIRHRRSRRKKPACSAAEFGVMQTNLIQRQGT